MEEGEGDGSILDLGVGSSIDGSFILTEDDLSDPNWEDIVDIPPDFLDGEDNDSFADISCGSGQSIAFNGSIWDCVSPVTDFSDLGSIPTGLSDGDDFLTESQVENYVTNGTLNFAAGSQVEVLQFSQRTILSLGLH